MAARSSPGSCARSRPRAGRSGASAWSAMASTAAAKALGVTPAELGARLRAGASLKDLATTAGMPYETVSAAALAAVKADLDKAVAAGTIRQARADRVLDRITRALAGRAPSGGPSRRGRGAAWRAPCRRPVPDPVRPRSATLGVRGHARARGGSRDDRGARRSRPRFRSAPHSGWARLTVQRASAMVRRSSSLRGSSITMHRARRPLWAAGIFSLLAAMLPFVAAAPVLADTGATVPAGFQDEVVLTGLDHPMSIVFAPNGNVFVAEKRGVIKFYTSLADTTPTVFADLNTNVHNYWDRGLMGLAVDPGYPTRPYVYVLYAYNHILGDASPAPRWPSADALVPPGSKYDDRCPNPPRATVDGCVVSGRLSRLTVSGGVMSGSEHVLIEDWCQQFPSHSVGSLHVRSRGRAVCVRGRGRQLQRRRGLRPARRHAAGHADAGQSVRRSAAARTRPRRRPRVAPSGAGHADRRRPGRRSTAPSSGSIPTRAPAGPTTPRPAERRQRPPDHRLRAAQSATGSRSSRARTRCGSATSASTRGRRSTGWSMPTRPPATSAGRATRAERVLPAYAGLGLSICNNLTAGDVTLAVLHLQPPARSVVAGDGCGVGSSSISGLAFLPATSAYPAADQARCS